MAHTGTLYTVTATVMWKPGEAPHACAFEPLPLPPIGCGGPDVAGFDPSKVGGSTRFSNGVVATGYLRLVGTWDGRALSVTVPPEHASPSAATPVPRCNPRGQQVGAPSVSPVMQRVIADSAILKSHGIVVLEFGMCGAELFMAVAVAGTGTVDFLTGRYGDVQVASWLKPLSP